MRSIIFSLLTSTLVLTSGAFAQTDSTDASSPLKNEMKQIGTIFKALGSTVSDASKNADNAAAAEQLITLFGQAKNEVPDVVKQMPQDQQADALADFQSTIQKEIDFATQLDNDFQSNNNADAAQVYQQMTDTKQDGHSKYNP